MALSRLENLQNDPSFSKIYVDPNNFDSTDSIENRGTSPNRPFFSIARAAIEAAMASYVLGRNNDRNDRTTIVVSPGTHYIDNRPGFSIQNINNTAVFKKRTSANIWETASVSPFSENSNFDVFDPNNDLYKFNSIHGGIILPRGTSIVGTDLRKTKIRPLYVPDPLDDDIERSSIFNVTGSCYFSTFTFFDADLTKFSYKNYSNTRHVPKYSHNKLTTFVYADGVSKVNLGLEQTDLTDLQMYYYKITHAYNTLSGRDIPDYPQSLDFEPNINEFRIVGAFQENPLGISSIRAGNGDGTGDSSIITVTTANLQSKIEEPHNFSVDTSIIIKGVTQDPNSFNGSFTVREVVGVNTFTFITPNPPQINQLPPEITFDNATVSVESDTVSSASPYIFNCSLRSVYGMCGMWADGAKADGFKSMVVAQYTGISLQKDDDAYLIYDDKVFYDDSQLKTDVTRANLRPLHQNSRAIYKPGFENFHIRASNDAFIQAVSIFAIGYAKHFVTESGADMSITNSNSNFGANALNSVGFRKVSFDRDDTGYITHIIPPKELNSLENEINWIPLDLNKIKSVGNSTRLYLSGFTVEDIAPDQKIENYRVGARKDDTLYVTQEIDDIKTTYSALICMPVPVGTSDVVSRKEYVVLRNNGINEITNNILTLNTSHQLFNGEKVRIFSDTGQAPDGLQVNKVYYAITNELNSDQLKLASTFNDAMANTPVPLSGIQNNGGVITVVSTVTDKTPGELGHPVQWDSTENQWYLNVLVSNEIFNNRNFILNPTPTTFIKRIEEDRKLDDRLYKVRYVVPKDFLNAKPPQVGFVLQESKNVAITTSADEGIPLINSTELRNTKIISNASVGSLIEDYQIVTISTELPHNFIPGDTVKVQNIRSTNNLSATGIVSTYNGEYKVLSVPSSKQFTYKISGVKVNPGTFTNNINLRTTTLQKRNLPIVSRLTYKNNFYIYSVDTIQEYSPGNTGKDGIYYLTILSSSVNVNENVGYGLSEKSFRQDVRNLYPQVDRDNVVSNPSSSTSYADLITIGKVITDDKKNSVTLEAINKFNFNTRIGFGINNVSISGAGNTTITITTDVEHKLNSIKSLNLVSNGTYSPNSTVFSAELIDLDLSGENATCKYTTNGSGTINPSSIKILDSGSAYTIGETLEISGGSPNAVVEVTEINNHIGDALELFDFKTTDIDGIYEIISIPDTKTIVLYASAGVSTSVYSPNTSQKPSFGYLASKGVGISSVVLSNLDVGIATVTTTEAHGLVAGNKFKYVNSDLSFYEQKDFIVDNVVGITTFTFNVGVATTTQTPTTGKILKYGISSNDLTLDTGEDNLISRACYFYSGITTTITAQLSLNSNTVSLSNSNGFNKGDFILINGEILRVSLEPSSNTINVLRAQLGTSMAIAPSGSVVKKIKILPIETRRPAYMRASGHTFEYLGFGPGNYSTALPQRQDRILDEDEILVSQARKEQAGIVVYTGMNDIGEFYTGSKKSSAITNKETTIEAPIVTYTGDDVDGEGEADQTGVFDSLIVRDNILVEGSGSQFFGSVEFKNKLTNHSNPGITVKNLFIKNRDSTTNDKLIVVGNNVPSLTSIPTPSTGYISILNTPLNYIGHTYKDGSWRQWGLVSLDSNELNVTVDRIGIGTTATSPIRLNVFGKTRLENLEVTGTSEFSANVNFGNASFSNLTITKTATFKGVNTSYTQIHEQGISKLYDLEIVGVSTFTGISTFNSKVDIDNLVVRKNINIGVADSNTISTNSGNLKLVTPNGKVNVDSDLSVTSNEVSITTSRGAGFATAFITDSRILRLGVGNTGQESYFDLNNDSTFDYGLRVIRASGTGSQPSYIIHRGNLPFILNALDNGADFKILTNDTDRFIVGSSGIVTYIQDNSEEDLLGAHFRISQRGTGDSTLSWDCADLSGNKNPIYRWYAGIDVSDGHSWKLASPSTTVPYGDDTYDEDTKIKVDEDGNLTILSTVGISTINGSNFSTNQNSFNLLGTTNTTSVNAFGSATSINLGANSGTLTLRNPTVVGTQATQNLYNTVATTVNVFGSATSINLGANSGTLTLRNPTVVGTQATQNLYNTVATTVNVFGSATSINLGANSGTLTLRNPTVVGTQQIQNLYNTVASSVNAFGAAVTLNLGANTGTLTLRNPTVVGTQATQNLYNTVATTVNAFGAATNIDIGANSGTTTIKNNLVISGNLGIGVQYSAERVSVNGNIVPSASETYTLGTSSLRWKTIYADVEGTVTGASSKLTVRDTDSVTSGFILFSNTGTDNTETQPYVDGNLTYNSNTNTLSVPNLTISSSISLGDNDTINLGNSNDLKIFFNGNNSFIENNFGDLYLKNTVTTKKVYIQVKNPSNVNRTVFVANGDTQSAELYSNGSKKLETTSSGVSITGSLSNSGSVNIGGSLDVTSTTKISESLTANSVTSLGNIVNGGFDFILGNGNQSERGNSGFSRALVKDSGATLVLNYVNDFGGGVRVDSSLYPNGNDKNLGTSNNKWNTIYGNTFTGTANNAVTLDGIELSQFLRSDTNDTFSGNLTNNKDNYITFGPNSTWSRSLRIGGNGYSGSSTIASIVTTDGDLHLSAAKANHSTYLNYYAGSRGVGFGNGNSGIVAFMGPDGDLWKGSADNTGSKYWHAGNDGSGSGLDADLLDGENLVDNESAANSVVGRDSSGNITANQYFSTNNGNGTNYRIGDDCWIGDINVANTFRISGVANADRGFITFGNASNTALGRIGSGVLTWGGNEIWHAGNDGSGSGLDADVLDGFNSDRFLRSLGWPGYGNWNSFGNNQQSVYEVYQENFNAGTNTGSSNYPSNVAYRYGTLINFGANSSGRAQIYISHQGNDLTFRGGWGTGGWQTWNRVWTDVNDGSGSGLDADLLDGMQPSSSGGTSNIVSRDSSGNFSASTGSFSSLYGTRIISGPYAGHYKTGNVTGLEIKNNGGTGDTDLAAISFHCQNSYGMHMHLRADGFFGIGGWSASEWRWYVNMKTGDMAAVGDITAFASDERLKENIKPIENALDKVSSLSGFTYNFNEIGKSLGFDGNIRYAGVSAQQVQKVLPEVIKPCPADKKYNTVQYEKLVPLLIEAIKELSNKVDDLQKQLDNK